ncbi:transmembrane protein, putative (macronuclear) [Tetrahymena thermophila SB210]|uniref:Transmembrane protein, putative n=1 Tax=Tetrahymena thermophila (strain SB210) TaxID=312017 RepID=W7XI08_TETTS|nr:transmembrane protein, putative [Tetrahymena thermophila SB210]EWS72874.1 transmembrane protein, putative [Tetrahymena thermophila SB210]|eukprot:XP_012654602.1 transmembrane protein, putative [Tetrahymena thermophila SB210]
MQPHRSLQNQENILAQKPRGDEIECNIQESNNQIYRNMKTIRRENINIDNHNSQKNEKQEIEQQKEYKIAKELLGIQDEKVDENKKKYNIEMQYLIPIFMFGLSQYTLNENQNASNIQEKAFKKQEEFNNFENDLTQNNQNPTKEQQNQDELIDNIGLNGKFIGIKQKLSQHQEANQNQIKREDINNLIVEQEVQNLDQNTKSQAMNENLQHKIGQIEDFAKKYGNLLDQGASSNMELIQQMCEKGISDLKVLGTIYLMLICLLTQFNMNQLAQNLYFKFQKDIMQVQNDSQMFDMDIYSFIEKNINSVIYLNELIILALRFQEFIPLLNIFLLVFQVRIHIIRDQIISAMSKKSLSSLEIIIGNYKKRVPKKKSKRIAGNQKIKKAMEQVTSYYVQKGSIENEHELLLFIISEGFHQISVELLMYFVETKLIPPQLFITKKVIKQSLINMNIAMFSKAFLFRQKWVKSLFLTEKIFLHICQLIRCNETFAEGLYLMKKISQKKQRSSAPLWYTENIIELFEEVAQKQSQFYMLQIYTLNPVISAIIISKILYKLSLNKNPLQIQLSRLSDHFKNLAIQFRDQITDERQMKMTLFKIIFPSDKSLVQICKSKIIYTYYNEFLQQDLVLKLLFEKYESSNHYDMNLLSSSTSFNYLFNFKKIKVPYLHYQQKFEKIETNIKQPSAPLIKFNINQNDLDQVQEDKQFFGHLLQQKVKSNQQEILKLKSLNNNQDPNELIKQYKAAFQKKEFNNKQPSEKYEKKKKSSQNIQFNTKRTLNIFKEIVPISFKYVSKLNHFYQYNIYIKSLKIRSYLEMILYFAIFNYSLSTFFQILDLSNVYLQLNPEFVNLLFNCPSKSLQAEIAVAMQTYVPRFTIEEIQQYQSTNLSLFCSMLIELTTGNIQKYMNDWQDDCVLFVGKNQQVTTIVDNFNRSIYFIYLIPVGFILKVIHSQIIQRRYKYDITEYIDIFLVYLCIQHYFINSNIEKIQNSQDCNYLSYSSISNNLQALVYVLTLILVCLFGKVIQFLSRNEKLGILIKIINLTFRQVFSVLFIFSLDILAFASLLYLLSSYRLDIYDSFANSIRTLIATTLGTFDYNNMDLAESIIQTVFLFTSNVIMINLLIAILTTTYSQITQRSSVEYALILFEEYFIGKFDKNYSLLIAFPPPFNLFQLLFSWVLFFQKLVNINQVFQMIGYTLLLLIVYAVFISINVILVPLAWFKMIFTIIKHEYQSMILNLVLIKKQFNIQNSCFQSKAYCIISQTLVLIFKLLQWIIFGLPYLLFHAIFTDSIIFIKSAYSSNNNKYKYNKNLLNSPLPQRCYYLLKCQPQIIDYRFKSESNIQHFQLFQNYLKFKFLLNAAENERKNIDGKPQKLLQNYFLKVVKNLLRRKNLMNKFNKEFNQEYQNRQHALSDTIQNEHTDPSFLAIMRTKQIYLSTEFWQKKKVTTLRQQNFYNLAINPSIKHTLEVQQSLIKKVQSQNQHISQIRSIQNQMSNIQGVQHSNQNSFNKIPNTINKQQTQRQKLHTLYEQIEVE